jgi:hypothetical protein
LEYINPDIQTILLQIGNKSAKFDIDCLLRFKKLENLFLQGWKKDIDRLGKLKSVKSLILYGVTVDDYSFINQMDALTGLSIRFGASKDFSALCGNKKIEILEFWRVSNLENIDVIAHLPNLKLLSLMELKHIIKFPDLSNSLKLQEIIFDNMFGLMDFTALETVPNLELFYGRSTKKIPAVSFIPVLKNPSLKSFFFWGSNFKEDAKLNEYIQKYMQGKNNKPVFRKYALQF